MNKIRFRISVHKTIGAILVVSSFFFQVSSASPEAQTSHVLGKPDGRVMVVAHRACWRMAPENSLKAIEKCIAMGVDMVEIDVRRSADGELVIIHDKTLDRTTNGKGRVGDFNLAELKLLKLKEGKGGDQSSLTDMAIPTLEEVLHTAKGRILVNIDAKDDVRTQAFGLVENLGLEKQVIIKSKAAPDDEALKSSRFVKAANYMPVIYECGMRANVVCAPVLSAIVEQYAIHQPVAYEIVYQSDAYLSEGVASIREHNARVWVNTLGPSYAAGHDDDSSMKNPDSHWGYLVEMGVNMIQTDRPVKLVRYLKFKFRSSN